MAYDHTPPVLSTRNADKHCYILDGIKLTAYSSNPIEDCARFSKRWLGKDLAETMLAMAMAMVSLARPKSRREK